MKRFFAILFCSLACHSFNCVAQDATYTNEVIRHLTSAQLHGRGYVSNGDKKTARFLAREFKKTGLNAAGNEGFFQPFRFPVNRFPGKVDVKINGRNLRPGIDYIIDPSSAGIRGKFNIVSYGDWKNTITSKHDGKQWILTDTAGGRPKPSGEDIKAIREGEAGLIVVNDKKLTWGVSTQCKGAPVIQLLRSALPASPVEIEIDIDQEFKAEHKACNVIGMVEGRVKDTFIVFTAHYDHLGRMGRKTFFPGANDNASGVSMLLNLAKHYKSPHATPKYSLLFIAFAGEEAGLMGSKHYTEQPTHPLGRIRFLLNMDLLGTGDDGLMVVNATEFPNEFLLLDSINREQKLLPEIGRRGKAANSDHYWFSEKEVPAFFIYTLGGIAAYHDIFDRADTLPLTRYSEVFRLITSFTDAL